MGIQLEALPLRRPGNCFAFDIPLRLAFLILDDEIWAGRGQVKCQYRCLLRPLKDINNITRTVVEHHDGQLTYGVIDHRLFEQRAKAIGLVLAMMLDPDDSTFGGKPWIDALDCRK